MSDKPVPPSVAEFTLQERQQLLATIERLKEAYAAELNMLAGRNYNFRMELAALKAQPSGVVLPERDDVIRKAVGMCNRIPGSTTWNAAEYAYDEFVARLNSPPVSAGVKLPDDFVCDSKPLQDLLNATAMLLETPCPDSATYWAAMLANVEALLKPASAGGVYSADPLVCSGCAGGCFRCRTEPVGVDERAALWPELSGIGRDISHPRALVLYFRGVPKGEAIRSIQECLRSAASAPNHSEQVREGWQLVPVEPTRAMRYSVEKTRLASAVTRQSTQHEIGAQVYAAMLAAAPSAGSQKEQV